ncbi:MAG TPA: OsmC family peroxiredoxin [Solirubrobacterales bacterium]|nr:OsmC family peroxiredoxin [Solirubrobacterales bacterium]
MATRNGSAEWRGDLKGGSGTVKVGDGVFEGNYSFSSRFEEGAGTNPEELIAAAHAGCFAMALSLILTEADHPPETIKAEARVHLRIVDELPTIAKIDLDVTGSVPGINEEAFNSYAEKAKDGCVVSRALAGVPEITISARLA